MSSHPSPFAVGKAGALRAGCGLLLLAAAGQAAGQAGGVPTVPLDFVKESRSNNTVRLDPHLGNEITQSFPDDIEARRNLREVFAVRLERGEAAQFDVTSEKVDPVAQIYSETGELLAEDDDGGGDSNSRLYFANTQGKSNRFYVVVTTVGGREGSFKLGISRRNSTLGRRPCGYVGGAHDHR